MDKTPQLVKALGARISGYRIARNLKQAELASAAGIDRTTLLRLEKGIGTIDTLARVLIALNVQERLLEVVPDTTLNPLDPMAAKGKQRSRVRNSRSSQTNQDSDDEDRWTWGDD